MTTNRMALVPRKVTADFLRDHGSAYAKDDWDGFIIAAPNGGKVSREDFMHVAEIFAPYIICTKATCADMAGENCLCGKEARAVIEALGLELEE